MPAKTSSTHFQGLFSGYNYSYCMYFTIISATHTRHLLSSNTTGKCIFIYIFFRVTSVLVNTNSTLDLTADICNLLFKILSLVVVNNSKSWLILVVPSGVVIHICPDKVYTSFLKVTNAKIDTRKQWVRFVQTKQANFNLKSTSTAILCGTHFSDNCFSNLMEYKSGFARKLNLKKDAVPTIHAERPVPVPVDTHAHGAGIN